MAKGCCGHVLIWRETKTFFIVLVRFGNNSKILRFHVYCACALLEPSRLGNFESALLSLTEQERLILNLYQKLIILLNLEGNKTFFIVLVRLVFGRAMSDCTFAHFLEQNCQKMLLFVLY